MKKNLHGFTLVEVLIALAIAAVLATAMAALFANTVKAREQVDKDGQRIEAGRYALDVLGDDIRMAGYYGDFQPRSSAGGAWPGTNSAATTWTVPAPCATVLGNLGWQTSGPVNVPVPIMAYEAHGVSITAPACLSNYLAGTDILVVRRVSTMPQALGSSAITVGDVYLQASNCDTTSVDHGMKFIVSNSQADFALHKMNCSTVSTIQKYIVRIYYIASCNVCGSDAVPTLKMAELEYSGGALAMIVKTVAPGIEDMHVEFGIDGVDGSVDNFQLSDATATPAFAWQNVMATKVFLLARDLTTTSNYTNSKAYVMGQKTVAAKDDHYKRAVFSSTLRLVNPSGARES